MYIDPDTNIRYQSEIACIAERCLLRREKLRAQHQVTNLHNLISSLEDLKEHARCFNDIISWLTSNQKEIGENIRLLQTEHILTRQPVDTGLYLWDLKLLGSDDGPTPINNMPFSCFEIVVDNEPGYLLTDIMHYLDAGDYLNTSFNSGRSNKHIKYTVTLLADTWSFVASRCLYALLRHERGCVKSRTTYSNPGSHSKIQFDSMAKVDVVERLLSKHFPALTYDKFMQYEFAGLFPHDVDAFSDTMLTFKEPIISVTSIELPDVISL